MTDPFLHFHSFHIHSFKLLVYVSKVSNSMLSCGLLSLRMKAISLVLNIVQYACGMCIQYIELLLLHIRCFILSLSFFLFFFSFLFFPFFFSLLFFLFFNPIYYYCCQSICIFNKASRIEGQDEKRSSPKREIWSQFRNRPNRMQKMGWMKNFIATLILLNREFYALSRTLPFLQFACFEANIMRHLLYMVLFSNSH